MKERREGMERRRRRSGCRFDEHTEYREDLRGHHARVDGIASQLAVAVRRVVAGGGDDTILVICRGQNAASALEKRFAEMAQSS